MRVRSSFPPAGGEGEGQKKRKDEKGDGEGDPIQPPPLAGGRGGGKRRWGGEMKVRIRMHVTTHLFTEIRGKKRKGKWTINEACMAQLERLFRIGR